MNNFDLRKFLAEQKQIVNMEEALEEVESVEEVAEEAVEETVTEGMDLREGMYEFLQQVQSIPSDHEDSHQALMDCLEDFYGKLKAHFEADEAEIDQEADDIHPGHQNDTVYEGEEVEEEMIPEVEVSEEASEEVKEYVKAALAGKDANEVAKIIERQCSRGALEMQMEVLGEIIEAYENKINTLEEDISLAGLIDGGKMKEMKNIVKGLHKEMASCNKVYEKKYAKEEK
jgi:hypothetical protein